MAFDAKTASDPQFTDLLLEGEGGDADGLHSLCKVRALVSLFLNVTHFQVMVGGELVNVEALHNSSPPKSRKKMRHNTTFWSSWPFFYFICHLHALHMHFFFSMRKPKSESLRCRCKSLSRCPPRRRSSSARTTTTRRGGIFLLFSPQK